MRDLGYSLDTAIADLIDNSISAGADTIDIVCDVSGDEPLLVILDNGKGMTEVELLGAMRHGASNQGVGQHVPPNGILIASTPQTTGSCPFWTAQTFAHCHTSNGSAAKVLRSSGGKSTDWRKMKLQIVVTRLSTRSSKPWADICR
jgi:hypothetical protein